MSLNSTELEQKDVDHRPPSRMKYQIKFVIMALLFTGILFIGWVTFSTWDDEPARTFTAAINRDCAPWDGAAFTVKIPLNGRDVIDISIWQSPDIQHPSVFLFPDDTGQVGNALLLVPVGLPEQLTGKVSFQRLEQGIPVEGEIDLFTETGTQFQGKFIAEWGNEIVYCG